MKASLIFTVLFLVWFLTSCSLQVAPDGTLAWSLDGVQVARAIIISSGK